ncbi:MAG: insulinase family protein [Oscillospiraceae bacterium]|nr:insulinase family protein [Oscillospiraceae bacterium]
MELTVGQKLHGFTVTRIRQEEELHGALVEMTHDKTGAQLCWLDNGEENKLFSVTFKTLPEDSTGVPHIIEHSVLCGSDKYPVKEPFVDLLKSSMNTFLNAMTSSDFTTYPISSRNKQDYLNLTEVYLDAVFAPALLHDPNIFYQEGHHTEIAEDGTPSYKGVVFNEMKGAMSGADRRIWQDMATALFPDITYGVNSGGEPTVIPDLTYEMFKDFYKKFYHPSNARFFLDGDVPLSETLERIEGYLKGYERSNATYDIPLQAPVNSETTDYYELDANQSLDKKAFLSLGKIVGTWQEKEKIAATRVLFNYLADTNESPLSRAVLSSGLAEDVELSLDDSSAQPMMLLMIRNMDNADSDKLRSLIRSTVENILKEGLNKADLTASLNRVEYQARDRHEPQGLMRAFQAMGTWLYGGDPMDGLLQNETFAKVRAMADNGGFESLLRELFLDETGLAVIHTLPSHTLGQELRQAEANRVKKEVEAMTPAELQALKEANAALLRWQQTPDRPEDTATLPVLPLSEVGPEPVWTETVKGEQSGVKVLHHPVPSHGIVHLSLYFPLTAFSQEDLPRLQLLSNLLGELPTRDMTAGELQQAVKTYIGSLSFQVEVFAQKDQTGAATPCLAAYASVLEQNLAPAQELLVKILTQTDLTQADRIRELAAQADEHNHQYAMGGGNTLGLVEASSHYSALGAARESLEGYTAMNWLHTLVKDFDAQAATLTAALTSDLSKLVGKASLTVSVTADAPVELTTLLNGLPAGTAAPAQARYTSKVPHRMGITIPAQISFAEKAFHLSKLGVAHHGSLHVLGNIMTYGYLWSEIRVQGGAYGCGFRAPTVGDVTFHSYRDPSPARSLGVYNRASDFVKEFCAGDEDLVKFIISTIGNSEPLVAPARAGRMADTYYFSGVTLADRKENRKQMLETTRQSLLGWCSLLEQTAKEGAVCVVGHEEALKACGELEIFSL